MRARDDNGTWGTSGLSVAYGRRRALEDVSFDARPGEIAVVVGEDGAGKTTLLRCLAGVVRPSEGEVRRPEREHLGYLAPRSSVYPDLTVQENIDFRATAYHVSAEDTRRRTGELLDRAGLATVRQRLARQLSGGMRQKLGVIAAMLHDPVLLVLDEPTTGVDPVSRTDVWWLVARAAAAGAAVVLSTSYLDEAERGTAVLALHDGQVLASGTPESIAASVPGDIRRVSDRPAGEEAKRAWRRAGTWRVWEPDAAAGRAGSLPDRQADAVQPDLQDAVTVAVLARELHEPFAMNDEVPE